MRLLISRAAAVLALASLAACSDSTSPVPSAEGTYVATTFLTGTSSATAQDLIAAGGSFTMTLASGGRMSSAVEIPASISGDNITAGTTTIETTAVWTQDGSRVTVVDLFAGMDPGYSASSYTLSGDSLTAEETANGAYVKIVMQRRL